MRPNNVWPEKESVSWCCGDFKVSLENRSSDGKSKDCSVANRYLAEAVEKITT